ncbi:Caffeoylshikimate esterase [Chlorella vulgaris]
MAAAMEDTATAIEWLENGRGLKLCVRVWAPSGTAVKAVLVLVHGFTWHSLYFSEFAAKAAAQGVEVVSFDLQGHGRSESLNGVRGYARRMSDFSQDAAQVLAWARQRHAAASPGHSPPAVLGGESMGGAIVLRLLLLQQPELQQQAKSRTKKLKQQPRLQLAGVLLLGPVVRVAATLLPPAPVLWVLRQLARFFPTLPVPDDSIQKGFESAFGDPEFAARAKLDPLVVLQAPRIGMAVELLDSCAAVSAALEHLTLPLLALHGALDTRTEPANTLDLGRRAASRDKTVRVVEGAYHQLLQDQPGIREAVTQQILAWVLERAGGG